MVWFKVDDKLHAHNKVRKVLAEEPAALALWTVAGSWSADNLQDGFVPDHQIPWLMPANGEQLAQMLVTARLWRRVKGGYRFHQWEKDGDGTRRNPTRAEVELERQKKAEAGRKGGLISGKRRSKPQAGASANASAGASRLLQPPTRPSALTEQRGEGLAGARAPAPPDNHNPHGHDEPPITVFDDPVALAAMREETRQEAEQATRDLIAARRRATNGAALARAALDKPRVKPVKAGRNAMAELRALTADLDPPTEGDP